MTDNCRSFKAFSIIEVILVVAILSILVTTGATIGIRSFTQQQLVANRDLLTNMLYQSQAYARAGVNGSDWGIRIQSNNQLYLFSGSSFATRDANEDVVFNLAENVVIAGTNEVVFERVSGFPISTASISLSDGGETLSITINSIGTIDL